MRALVLSDEDAEKYADILFDFVWKDDFSKARNAVMDKCSGKWYLSIDADEYLNSSVDELCNFLKSASSDDKSFATITLRNHNDSSMNGTFTVPPRPDLAAVAPYLAVVALPAACSISIVPDEVIGLPVTDNGLSVAVELTPTEVTVPEGSSPEGISTHSVPLQINESPTLAATPPYVPSEIRNNGLFRCR